MFLLRKDTAEALKAGQPATPAPAPEPEPGPVTTPVPEPGPPAPVPGRSPPASTRTLRLVGSVPPEVWNRLGTKILPKLRSGSDLKIGLEFLVTVPEGSANSLAAELRQILQELGLGEAVTIE